MHGQCDRVGKPMSEVQMAPVDSMTLRHPSRARRVRDYLISPRARPSAVIATVAVLIVSSVSAVFFMVQAMVIASCP